MLILLASTRLASAEEQPRQPDALWRDFGRKEFWKLGLPLHLGRKQVLELLHEIPSADSSPSVSRIHDRVVRVVQRTGTSRSGEPAGYVRFIDERRAPGTGLTFSNVMDFFSDGTMRVSRGFGNNRLVIEQSARHREVATVEELQGTVRVSRFRRDIDGREQHTSELWRGDKRVESYSYLEDAAGRIKEIKQVQRRDGASSRVEKRLEGSGEPLRITRRDHQGRTTTEEVRPRVFQRWLQRYSRARGEERRNMETCRRYRDGYWSWEALPADLGQVIGVARASGHRGLLHVARTGRVSKLGTHFGWMTLRAGARPRAAAKGAPLAEQCFPISVSVDPEPGAARAAGAAPGHGVNPRDALRLSRLVAAIQEATGIRSFKARIAPSLAGDGVCGSVDPTNPARVINVSPEAAAKGHEGSAAMIIGHEFGHLRHKDLRRHPAVLIHPYATSTWMEGRVFLPMITSELIKANQDRVVERLEDTVGLEFLAALRAHGKSRRAWSPRSFIRDTIRNMRRAKAEGQPFPPWSPRQSYDSLVDRAHHLKQRFKLIGLTRVR